MGVLVQDKHYELTPLKIIANPKGEIRHALKASETSFKGFGEAYFTSILSGEIKGWKRHSQMTLNLVVPVGDVEFFLHEEESGASLSIRIGESNYCRLTIKPGIWVAFKGSSTYSSLILNLASIQHDPIESRSVSLETFPLL